MKDLGENEKDGIGMKATDQGGYSRKFFQRVSKNLYKLNYENETTFERKSYLGEHVSVVTAKKGGLEKERKGK